MTHGGLASIPHVADVAVHRGAAAAPDAVPDLLLEVPHGATKAEHFDALLADLAGPFPDDLRSFFFVNTDVGAPEVAEALAAGVVEAEPTRTALVIRCLVPRTFIDCNRVIAPDAKPKPSALGETTPGLAPYARDARDQRLLLGRYAAYRALVTGAMDAVCGGGGEALMVHSYAPRQVDVAVDDHIVELLRAAYAPERVGTWPLRPEIDMIVETAEGERPMSERLVGRLREALEGAGFEVAEGRTYRLHPGTMAHHFARAHPGRTLCFEMRRDLLVEAFTPFAEMRADPAKVARVVEALAGAVRA